MNKNDIFAIIAKHAQEVVPSLESHVFAQDDALRDLGANSIDRAEITMMTLETLALRIPLTELAGAQNMGELAALIHSRMAASVV